MSNADFHVHDDILEFGAAETFDRGDAERLFALLADLRRRHPRVFLLVRAGGPGMTTDARRTITDWFKKTTQPLEAAMYGGSAVHRTIVEMIRRAVDILSPGKLILDAYKTRDEALAWIAARRGTPLA